MALVTFLKSARKSARPRHSWAYRHKKNPNQNWLGFVYWWWNRLPKQTASTLRLQVDAGICGFIKKVVLMAFLSSRNRPFFTQING
jgi:hypothetical protein